MQAGFEVLEDRAILSCENFVLNWPELEAINPGHLPAFLRLCMSSFSSVRLMIEFLAGSEQYAARMPNPDRILSEQDKDHPDWECPPLIVFCDDMSGNSTKQWNIHYSCYLSNATLPRKSVEKESNIHFISTSPHAAPLELIEAICDSIK